MGGPPLARFPQLAGHIDQVRRRQSPFPSQSLSLLAVLSLLVLGLPACDSGTTHNLDSRSAGITLDVTEASLGEGSNLRIRAFTVDGSGALIEEITQEVEWSSSAPAIADVHTGLVEAHAQGSVRITARSAGDHEASAEIVVHAAVADAEPKTPEAQDGRAGQAPDPLEVLVVDRNGDAIEGVNVEFLVVSGGGSVDPPEAKSDSEGIARSTWTLGGETGVQHARAIIDGLDPVNFVAEVEAGPVAEVRLEVEELEVSGGDSVQLDAEVFDEFGNPVEGAELGWTSSDTTVAVVSTVGVLQGRAAGTTDVTARAFESASDASGTGAQGDASPAAEATVRVEVTQPGPTPGPGQEATLEKDGGDGQTGQVGEPLEEPLRVRVTDQEGSGLQGAVVEWAVTAGDGSVSRSKSATNAQGYTSTDWTLGEEAGTHEVQATTDDGGTVSFTATAEPGPLEKVIVQPGILSIEVGQSRGLDVTLRDAFGNEIFGATATAVWSSDNSSIASVSDAGVVTGNARGNTRITASVDGVQGETFAQVSGSGSGGGDGDDDGDGGSDDGDENDDGSGEGGDDDGEGDEGEGGDGSDGGDGGDGGDNGDGGGDNNDDGGEGEDGNGNDDEDEGDGEDNDNGPEDPEPEDPGTVTDLAVVSTTDSSATLQWTEVDDGTGNAAQYAIRWHPHPIGWNWGPATEVHDGPCAFPFPGNQPGEPISCTVYDLEPGKKLDFQVAAFRGPAGERVYGGLSIVATGTTKEPEEPTNIASVEASVPEVAFTALEQTEQVSATAFDEEGNTLRPVSLEWKSDDPEVATVDQSGRITARAMGTTLILVAAACCSPTGDTIAVVVEQEAAEVHVSPTSITLEEGESHQFSASAYDSNGFPVSNGNPTWSVENPNIASVSPSGLVTATGSGSTEVVAEFPSASGSGSVEVPADDPDDSGGSGGGGGSADRPNEPRGFSTWLEHDFSRMPEPGTTIAASHAGYIQRGTDWPNSAWVESGDATYPGPGRNTVYRIRYHAGLDAGMGVGGFRGRDQSGGDQNATELDAWYVSLWLKLEGPDWEFPPTELKLWYNAVGELSQYQGGTISINSPGTLAVERSAQMLASTRPCNRNASGGGCHINYHYTGTQINVGEWTQIEMYRKTSTPGRQDGILRVWVNGRLAIDANVQDQDQETDWTYGFHRFHWAPVYGGNCPNNGCPKTRDDFMRLGHLYISGEPRN